MTRLAPVPTDFVLDDLTWSLLIGSAVLLVAVAAVRISVRSGLPSLLIFLGIGLLLGENGLGIGFDSEELTQVLGYCALVLILAEGGLTTRWSSIRKSVAPAAVLSTVGVFVSVGVVAVAARYVLNLDWTVALLIGAILSSTDAAAVFSVLRTVPLPRRLSGMLEAESGFNDAPVVILVVALAAESVPTAEHHPWWYVLLEAGVELVGGTVIGLLVGWAGAWLLRRVAGASSALFSIGVVSLVVLAYAIAATVHTSGFIAAYLSALVLGNLGLPHRAAVPSFSSALGSIAQIGLFIMLGLLASPEELPEQIGPAILIGLVLLLVARPLSVLVSLTPFRIPLRDQAFLSWAGLRGAVPIVLATVPATLGTANAARIFNLVFVLVIIFTLVQAPTLPWVARRLGLAESVRSVDLDVETTPLETMGADVIQVTVGERSRLHGVELFELRLPPGANVTLVVRDGKGVVPQGQTVLRHGDQLLVVSTADVRHKAEQRIRDVDEGGRLA
ncbi:MAG TPA: potassium/proton antiporter, partial [Lapillicoccus sp.]|nr:potassium/proton antiporter [Lapillicoccus sp.]